MNNRSNTHKIVALGIMLCVTTLSMAQSINIQGGIQNNQFGQNPFIDASELTDISGSIGKGFLFPRTDLTTWQFNTILLDGVTFPTAFDGMIVYNIGTGTTRAGEGIPQQVQPGFYYFSNPNATDSITQGQWLPFNHSEAKAETNTNLELNATTGNLKYTNETDNNPLIDLTTIEPWAGTDDNKGATANDEDLYTMGDIAIGSTTVNDNAAIEIAATDKGLLLPRVALVNPANAAPLNAHVEGMVVYNTNDNTTVDPGFYFNDGVAWQQLQIQKGRTTITNLSNNGDGTVSYLDETGTVNTVTITTLAENTLVQDGTVDITGDGIADNNVTLQSFLDNISTVVKTNETNTALRLNSTNGALTYTNEDDDNPTVDLKTIEPWYGVNTNEGATSNTQNIYTMGNVAIGESSPSPAAALSLGTGTSWSNLDKIHLWHSGNDAFGLGTSHGAMNIYTSDWQYNRIEFGYKRSDGTFVEGMRFRTKGGELGIGDGAPEAKLSLGHAETTDKLHVYRDNMPNGLNCYGFGVENEQFQMYSGYVGNAHIAFGYRDYGKQGRAPFIERMRLNTKTNGNLGIGTTNPTEKLDVAGNIKASGNLQSGTTTYPDYVFENYVEGSSATNKNYSFKTLEAVEQFIKTNKHLPGVTGIGQLQKTETGYNINVTQLSVQTLEKVEELYLHTIAQQKDIKELKTNNGLLKQENNVLKARLAKIEAALGISKQ